MELGADRRTVYRHAARPVRYRRARLVETASVAHYRPAREAAYPSTAYQDQPQPAAPSPLAQSPAENATEAAGQPEASSQPAMDAGANVAENDQPGAVQPPSVQPRPVPFTAYRSRPQQPARDAVAEASAASAADTVSEDPVDEAPASAGSEPEVASLAIPRGAMPAPLKGSLASLERQNDRLTAEGLERIENEDDLAARIANHLLIPLPASDALTVNPNLPETHRYCRPWTARFVADLARDHDAVFHRPLEVSSAVRTVEYQRRLMRINGNAAPAEGDVVSPHLTGATIDIAKQGLTRDEMKWMRSRLLQLEDAGKIDVEEEFQQSCFHITVYKTYAAPRARKRAVHPEPPVEAAAGPAAEGL